MHVLLIEPIKIYQQIISKILANFDIDITVKTSGKEGLEVYQHECFDLTCISMNLGDMTGVDFCKTLHEQNTSESARIIMLITDESVEVVSTTLELGAAEIFFISKLEDLSKYLAGLCEQGKEPEGLTGRVLLVEDTVATADTMLAYFREAGYEVDHFINAEQAYVAFEIAEYDLVVSDMSLNGAMSGASFVESVRRLEGGMKRVPILVFSEDDDVTSRIEILKNGANDCVLMPVQEEELMARVNNLIANKQLLDKVKLQGKHLEKLAMTDQLTSLYNRHFLADVAPRKISEAYRHRIAISLVVIDVDNFKVINDTHGHSRGDIVLVEIAKTLKNACRKEDIIARVGGEEFVIILSHCGAKDAEIKSVALCKEIENLNPDNIHVTASFGIAELVVGKQCDFNELFIVADNAVYQAKSQGRNCVVVGKMQN